MGVGVASGGSSGGRRRRSARRAPIAEINMTPFIDVMLVLLIVFMIAAPLIAVGVPLDLPKTGAGALNIDKKPLTVSIDAQGRVFLQDQEVGPQGLVPKLQATAGAGFDERVYVRGADGVAYGRVAEVMGLVTSAGYKRVALVTEPKAGK